MEYKVEAFPQLGCASAAGVIIWHLCIYRYRIAAIETADWSKFNANIILGNDYLKTSLNSRKKTCVSTQLFTVSDITVLFSYFLFIYSRIYSFIFNAQQLQWRLVMSRKDMCLDKNV